ncbi:MAG: response regulator transcription factor [Aquirufa sp.]|jgi:two-component system OmpR family response regulator|nr:response regulator transcription factor [Candidatus Nanopelagicaceae bacterium]
MASNTRILVVEDEQSIRDLIRDSLSLIEVDTDEAGDGLEALNKLRRQSFDLMILDVNLPKIDGFALLSKIREEGSGIPVLVLSARSQRDEITQGLKIGADDYLIKPFGIEELILRVKAILRRTKPASAESKKLICGPITMDQERHLVTFNSEKVELSATEFSLLEGLLNRSGKVVKKELLLAEVWGIDFPSNTTVVETYISYLRRKLHRDGYQGIKTVRGVGFQILGE